MREALHFVEDNVGNAACGVQIFLCDEGTDDQEHVTCGRCKRTRAFIDYDPRRFTVDIWNHEGDVVRHERHLTADEVETFREEYADRPELSVVETEE